MVLLDPVVYPGALKVFAREICKNDLLNFGRLHFFFPDSRLSLDLSTDRTLKVGGKFVSAAQPSTLLPRCTPFLGTTGSNTPPHPPPTSPHPARPAGGAL